MARRYQHLKALYRHLRAQKGGGGPPRLHEHVEVYWDGDDAWFPAYVARVDGGGRCLLEYEDGEVASEASPTWRPRRGPGKELVGRDLTVWWPGEGAWYEGTVTGCARGQHHVAYRDGDEADEDLAAGRWRLLPPARRVSCAANPSGSKNPTDYTDWYGSCAAVRGQDAYQPPRSSGEGGGAAPTVADFFCGAGGLSCGFREAGWRVVLGCDIDLQAMRTYRRNFGDTAHTYVGSIDDPVLRAEVVSRLKGVTCIVGGPPCQGFSMANTARDEKGGRNSANVKNSLPESFIDLCTQAGAQYIVMEEVPTLFPEVVKAVRATLRSRGYQSKTGVLLAASYGAPQMRRRFVLLAWRHGGLGPEHPPPPTHDDDPATPLPPFVTVREALMDSPPPRGAPNGEPAPALSENILRNVAERDAGIVQAMFEPGDSVHVLSTGGGPASSARVQRWSDGRREGGRQVACRDARGRACSPLREGGAYRVLNVGTSGDLRGWVVVSRSEPGAVATSKPGRDRSFRMMPALGAACGAGCGAAARNEDGPGFCQGCAKRPDLVFFENPSRWFQSIYGVMDPARPAPTVTGGIGSAGGGPFSLKEGSGDVYEVRYDDGELREEDLCSGTRWRGVGDPPKRLRVLFDGDGAWYGGRWDGRAVHYDDGEVTAENLSEQGGLTWQPADPAGQRVAVYWDGDRRWFRGRVERLVRRGRGATYRSLTVREAARLQAFPDAFEVVGDSRRAQYLQVGNAVPCALARAVAHAVEADRQGR